MGQPDLVEEVRKLEPRRVAVVQVDFQNDFCRPPGPHHDATQTQPNADAARRASEFASQAARLGVRVIYTKQILDLARLTPRQQHREETSRLCMAGSAGAELFIGPVPGSRVVRKYRFDIWHSQEFVQALADWDINGLMPSSEQPANRAVRDYLRSVHPTVERATDLLPRR